MKRNQFFALILALCLLLAGCTGGDSAQAPETTAAPVETTQTPETTAASTDATQAPAADQTVTLGTIDGSTYTNHYVGIGFTLDENWTIYPADQLQTLPEDLESLFDGTDLQNEEFTNIMDFLAENVNDLTTMNLNYTKLSMQERLAYAMMDDEAIIDNMLDNYYDTLVAAYANGGITVESMEKKTVTFLGQERTALYTVASVEDIPYYILQVYDYGLGAYGVTLTTASYVEDNTEGLLDLYYAVE